MPLIKPVYKVLLALRQHFTFFDDIVNFFDNGGILLGVGTRPFLSAHETSKVSDTKTFIPNISVLFCLCGSLIVLSCRVLHAYEL